MRIRDLRCFNYVTRSCRELLDAGPQVLAHNTYVWKIIVSVKSIFTLSHAVHVHRTQEGIRC